MSANAESPLTGKALDNDHVPHELETLVSAHNEETPIRPSNRDMSFTFRMEPPHDRDMQDVDGPVIRRVGNPNAMGAARPGLCTPTLFPQQFDDDEFPPSEQNPTTVPAMHDNLLGGFDEDIHPQFSRRENVSFSVAAIRAKRMKTPAGTYKPTSIVTKAFAAVFIGVFCVTSGVTLGLYGSDLGYQAKRQAQFATASVAGFLPFWGNGQSEANRRGEPQTAMRANTAAPLANGEQTGNSATRPVGGKKLFYDRIKPTTAFNGASQQRLPEPEIIQPAPARLTGLDAQIAMPNDLFTPVVANK